MNNYKICAITLYFFVTILLHLILFFSYSILFIAHLYKMYSSIHFSTKIGLFIYTHVFYSHLFIISACTVTLKQIPCVQTYLSIKLSLTSETFYSLIKRSIFSSKICQQHVNNFCWSFKIKPPSSKNDFFFRRKFK